MAGRVQNPVLHSSLHRQIHVLLAINTLVLMLAGAVAAYAVQSEHRFTLLETFHEQLVPSSDLAAAVDFNKLHTQVQVMENRLRRLESFH